MKKINKLFPVLSGMAGAIAEGIPGLSSFIKPFLKKKKTDDYTLDLMTREALIQLVKNNERKDDENVYVWALKTAITLSTVYFVVWICKQAGITYDDIINLFGLIK